jgi:hypothetical protein
MSQFAHRIYYRKKLGIAQLEFVLVLVVLIPLFLALLWSGMFGVALSGVTISARHEAWRQRQEVRARPFEFDDSSSGKISKSSSETIKLSTLFDSWAVPKSTSTVFGGSWDHRVIKLNDKSPNRQLAFDVAKRVPEAKIDNINATLSSLKEFINLDNLMDQVLSSVGIQSLMSDFAGLKSKGMEQIEESKRKASEAKENAKVEQKKKVEAKQSELDDLKLRQQLLPQKIREARAKRLDAKTDKDKKDLQSTIDGLEKESKKLESEIPNKQRELDLLKANPLGAVP